MQKIDESRIGDIFDAIRRCRIAVVGDLMIDRYVWGRVDRISPEAPVPIIALEGESSNLGGAANVAANVGALGAMVDLFGLVGDDAEGELLREIIRDNEYHSEGVVTDPSRRTSVKTRVISQSQHLLRIDRESVQYQDDSTARIILDRFHENVDSFQAVILQDYNKGVLSTRVIRDVIELCLAKSIPVGVDPKRDHFWDYSGVTLFKPNLSELCAAMGRQLRKDEDFSELGREAYSRLNAKYLLVTAGSRGMSLFTGSDFDHVPTQAQKVHDVSGAGDTVIATIMTTLAAGASIQEAAAIATWAASVVVAEVGAVPVDADKLRRVCIGR